MIALLSLLGSVDKEKKKVTSKQAIENLEQIAVTEEHCKVVEGGMKEFPQCSICFEEIKDKATRMPCGHLFNHECITQWLSEHN